MRPNDFNTVYERLTCTSMDNITDAKMPEWLIDRQDTQDLKNDKNVADARMADHFGQFFDILFRIL